MSESNRRRPEDPLSETEAAAADTAARLRDERPAPSDDFGDHLRLLLTSPPADRAASNASLRAQIAGSLAAGVILLALAAVGVAGTGPFAS
jgi:hypothetical protein